MDPDEGMPTDGDQAGDTADRIDEVLAQDPELDGEGGGAGGRDGALDPFTPPPPLERPEVATVAAPSRVAIEAAPPPMPTPVPAPGPTVMPSTEPREPIRSSWAQRAQPLFQHLDQMRQELDDSDLWQRTPTERMALQVTTGMTISFSAGFLAWLLRGGSLLASFMSAMPMWARFDPLPILAVGKRREDEQRDEPEPDESEMTLFGVRAMLDTAETTQTLTESDDTTTNVTRPTAK
jgi:hypothetical protein